MLGYGYRDLMNVGPGYGPEYGVLCFLTWLVVIVDLVLVGMWLWQRIKKERGGSHKDHTNM